MPATNLTTNYQSLFGGCGAGANMGTLLQEAISDAKAVRCTALASDKSSPGVSVWERDNSFMQSAAMNCLNLLTDNAESGEPMKAVFDTETQWGNSRTYEVKQIKFERKEIIHGFDIYYASREALVAMGIDLGTEKRISFPESFETKYAKPPAGWSA